MARSETARGGLTARLAMAALLGGLAVLHDPAPARADGSEAVSVGEAASYYRAFRRDIDALAGEPFASPPAVERAGELLMSYDPARLSQGFVAFQALVAATAEAFVERMRDLSAAEGPHALLASAEGDNTFFVLHEDAVPGIGAIMDDVGRSGDQLAAIALRLEARSYEFQGTFDQDKKGRKRLAEPPSPPSRPAAEPRGAGFVMPPPRSWPMFNQVLELAARLALGADDGLGPEVAPLVSNATSMKCLRWAKLNLAQCLAAAHLPSEHAYCVAKHGLTETAACLDGTSWPPEQAL